MRLNKLVNVKVLVVGDVMLDRYLFGDTKRISPEAPVPIVKVNSEEIRLGGACNVALNLATLGVDTGFIGITGNDLAGEQISELCGQHGIAFYRIQDDSHPTICKQRIISKHQQLLRLDFEDHSNYQSSTIQLLRQKLQAHIENYDVLIFSDYGKGSLFEVENLIAIANQFGKPVLIDPKGNYFHKYRNATLITPNQSEFEAIVGACKTDEILIEKAIKLREELNLQALLVTRSEKGMMLIEKDQLPYSLPAIAQDVFDVTGAGDTVISMLGAMLAAKASYQEAVLYANTAASIVIGKLGAAQVSIEELEQAFYEKDCAQNMTKIVDKKALSSIIKSLQMQNKKVVMTNGCFDLLHKGHVDYLQKARKLGDYLIVALNTDDSVRRLKGESRPVMPEGSRLAVMAALACVDFVLLFDEETPESLISELLPDILVKGADYQIDQVAGAKQVLANGGSVELIEFTEGFSSSNAINKIKASIPKPHENS